MKKKWPKIIPALTEEQKIICDEFMKHWHEILPNKYRIIENFNHGFPINEGPSDFLKTLEIGVGLGEHLAYEKLTPEQEKNYYALDIRKNMLEEVAKKYKNINILNADCQTRLNFDNDFFDRILAIHVLEHLPNLPLAIQEIYRLCNKKNGHVSVVIPCEGGLAYAVARKISAERIFKKKYKQSYKWLVKTEHINFPEEILCELKNYFLIKSIKFFPFKIQSINLNLCIGIILVPKLELPISTDSTFSDLQPG